MRSAITTPVSMEASPKATHTAINNSKCDDASLEEEESASEEEEESASEEVLSQ